MPGHAQAPLPKGREAITSMPLRPTCAGAARDVGPPAPRAGFAGSHPSERKAERLRTARVSARCASAAGEAGHAERTRAGCAGSWSGASRTRTGDLLGAIQVQAGGRGSRSFALLRDPSFQAKRTVDLRSASSVFAILLCQIRVISSASGQGDLATRNESSMTSAARGGGDRRSRRTGLGTLGTVNVPESRRYWSERQGRGPTAVPLTFEHLRGLVLTVVDEFWERDFFVESFGYYCVDNDWVDGTLGKAPERWFLVNIGRDNVWPIQAHGSDYDMDALFDMVEALHDLISKPLEGWYHDFGGCGMHWRTFDCGTGQEEFRAQLNPLLARYETPLELSATGEIVTLAPSEMRDLLDAPVPTSADHNMVTTRVDAAIALYRSRNSTRVDRRHAVRELADVLEALRSEIKEQMLPKDERELFHLANGFAIRHNTRDQRRDYDDALWLSWAFYVYLATIHAVLRLAEREQPTTT